MNNSFLGEVEYGKRYKHSYRKKKPFDLEWYLKEKREKWAIPLVLKDRAKKLGNRPFLQYQDEKPLSFKTVNALANRVANGLIESGIEKGDRIAVLLPNCADYIVIWFGILKAGGIMAPVNTAYKMDFLEYIIDNSDSKIIFAAEEYLERIDPIQKRIQQVKKIIVWTKGGGKDFDSMIVAVKKPDVDVSPEELIKHCEERMPYFMIPRFIRFVRSLPRTPTERVQKHILKEQGITEDTWDMEKAGYKVKR